MIDNLEDVRQAVKDSGVKLSKIADWAGVQPQTVTHALKNGTSNIHIVKAVVRALQVADASHSPDTVLPLWKSKEAPDA